MALSEKEVEEASDEQVQSLLPHSLEGSQYRWAHRFVILSCLLGVAGLTAVMPGSAWASHFLGKGAASQEPLRNIAVVQDEKHLVSLVSIPTTGLFAGKKHGEGTYYIPKDFGKMSCHNEEHSLHPGMKGTVAMNKHDLSEHGAHDSELRNCGMCVRVWAQGQGGGHDPMHWNGDVFLVSNVCPECSPGDLDFAFPDKDGRWKIQWQAVRCPTEPGGVVYNYESGTSRYYVKVRPLNVPVPVIDMELKNQRGGWDKGKMYGNDYAFYWDTKWGLKMPWQARLTFYGGETAIDSIPSLDDGAVGTKIKIDGGDVGNVDGSHNQCSHRHESCTASKCCQASSEKCFEKDHGWASCKETCVPGLQDSDPPEWKTEWTCKLIDKSSSNRCSHSHENCRASKCCQMSGQKCFEKDENWASCRDSCTPGYHVHDPPEHKKKWTCKLLT